MPRTLYWTCSIRACVVTEQTFSLDFCRAWGEPAGCADFRTIAEDFVVVEVINEPFDSPLSNDGGHVYLQIQKRNQNTRWVAALLAQRFGVNEQDVGYCGLKDRRALTTQWFSVPLSVSSPELYPGSLALADCEVLRMVRGRRKLRRGMHSGNTFSIWLRNFAGDIPAAEQRLITIANAGVPNYFGEQRFGIGGANLHAADAILTQASMRKGGRHSGATGKRGLYISAARSYLFNCVLSARVADGTWATPLDDEEITRGPLWGRGRSVSGEHLAKLEQRVLATYSDWCGGLEHCGLMQARRDLVLVPREFHWQWRQRDLLLEFALPPGTFATTILRELAITNAPARRAVL